ncbi:MAG: hypothetical protein LBI64_06780, partial [Coriobacteriales bacterium]|nr:hypothetical protein [Coriobacteriales bacterium]
MAEQSFPSRIGIGIDTGGTCTDALVYEFATGTILATGKAATTREDLSWGIGTALDSLPSDLLHRADIIMLSTTLATNACVEGKGGRAKLLLIGTPQQVLTRIDAEHDYGLQPDDVLCVPCASSFDGRIAEEPDWETLFTTSADWFAAADALSVAELYATHNGAVRERFAKTLLTERFDVPVICGHEVADELNMIERGTTALLNARLLPLVSGFMNAVEEALAARGVRAPVMIVRSDGSLMSEELGRIRPVETILSGPAASAL